VRSARLTGSLDSWRHALALCGVVVLIDQVSKAIVVSSIPLHEHRDLVLGFSLTNTTNTGFAFGVGSGGDVVLAVTAAALGLVLVWFALDSARPGLWIAVGLLTGGALGNLADRVRESAVTDFIDPPYWPTFNLADVAITLGALWLILSSLGVESEPAATRRRA
jgi:signal peptidase II